MHPQDVTAPQAPPPVTTTDGTQNPCAAQTPQGRGKARAPRSPAPPDGRGAGMEPGRIERP